MIDRQYQKQGGEMVREDFQPAKPVVTATVRRPGTLSGTTSRASGSEY